MMRKLRAFLRKVHIYGDMDKTDFSKMISKKRCLPRIVDIFGYMSKKQFLKEILWKRPFSC